MPHPSRTMGVCVWELCNLVPGRMMSNTTDFEKTDAEAVGASVSGEAAIPASRALVLSKPEKLTLVQRIEAAISRISTRNNFWHRLCAWIWLPLAYRSGIKMSRERDDASTFTAILPFKRFNKNWYNAMAGAALLGNAEVAGGLYVFKSCGDGYTVVCKKMEYKFLRPCMGPAMYRSTPRENIDELIESGDEFNITLDIEVSQLARKPNERERRVGKAMATFHVTPKSMMRARKQRAEERKAEKDKK